MIKTALLSVMEQAINTYLQLDPNISKLLQPLAGKSIAIEITDIQLCCYCLLQTDGLRLRSHYDNEPDTVIAGNSTDLLQATANKTRRLKVTGDIETAQQLSLLFSHINIDWEEHASHWLGDILAHQLANFFKQLSTWFAQTTESLQTNVTEYLQEEGTHLPPAEEVQDFFADIHQLRNDVERFSAKLRNDTAR